jgi:hypothetical protein
MRLKTASAWHIYCLETMTRQLYIHASMLCLNLGIMPASRTGSPPKVRAIFQRRDMDCRQQPKVLTEV